MAFLAGGALMIPGGVWPMLYAFFDRADRLDREAFRRQVEAAVANGAHGVAIMGLATEVNKLSADERRTLLQWLGEDLRGRLPFAVTVAEKTVASAQESVAAAEQAGCAFAILQPPPEKGLPESDYIRFFGAIADRASRPVAIQNAPDYIGIGLSVEGIRTLNRQHPNMSVIKAEGSALYVAELVEKTQRALAVFNGRCGLELTDNLRAGCLGMIPSTDSFDVQARIYDLMRRGDAESEAQAEKLYADLLPMLVFLIQSLDSLICYGKRVAAIRLGLAEVHDRAPALKPHPAGLEWARRYASRLPPLAH